MEEEDPGPMGDASGNTDGKLSGLFSSAEFWPCAYRFDGKVHAWTDLVHAEVPFTRAF